MTGSCAHRSRSRLWLFALAATLLSLASAPARADLINVGSIRIDQYDAVKTATLGGVDIIAHYTLNAAFGQFSACFTAADIRWLQRVTSSKDTGFTPTPNRPFIDPRSDQPGGFDNLPWYDATFNNLADAQNNANRQNGAGPYIMDQPRVLLNRGPYSFFAETLAVVQKDKMIAVLGGFSWGFSIAGDQQTVTALAITPLQDNAGLRTSFNAALGVDFPGYEIKDVNQIWPDINNTPFLTTVPEPGSLTLASLGGVFMVIWLRWRRAA